LQYADFSPDLTFDYSLSCDVTNKDAIAELAKSLTDREHHLDVLISNAGIRRDPVVPCDVLSASLPELQSSMWSSRHSDWADTFCEYNRPLLLVGGVSSTSCCRLATRAGRWAIRQRRWPWRDCDDKLLCEHAQCNKRRPDQLRNKQSGNRSSRQIACSKVQPVLHQSGRNKPRLSVLARYCVGGPLS
jgi:hypothetical protein